VLLAVGGRWGAEVRAQMPSSADSTGSLNTDLGQMAVVNPAVLARFQVGVTFLGVTYTGDLQSPAELFHRFYPAYALTFQLKSRRAFYPQFNVGLGTLIANNRNIPQTGGLFPNRIVITDYFYFDLLFNFKFFRRGKVHPYVGFGVGLLSYTPQDLDQRNLTDQITTREPGEDYAPVSPYGIGAVGVQYDINKWFSVNLSARLVYVVSDYFDNVGLLGPTPGPDALQSVNLSWFYTFQRKDKTGRSAFFR
jgi:hypothetical protein